MNQVPGTPRQMSTLKKMGTLFRKKKKKELLTSEDEAPGTLGSKKNNVLPPVATTLRVVKQRLFPQKGRRREGGFWSKMKNIFSRKKKRESIKVDEITKAGSSQEYVTPGSRMSNIRSTTHVLSPTGQRNYFAHDSVMRPMDHPPPAGESFASFGELEMEGQTAQNAKKDLHLIVGDKKSMLAMTQTGSARSLPNKRTVQGGSNDMVMMTTPRSKKVSEMVDKTSDLDTRSSGRKQKKRGKNKESGKLQQSASLGEDEREEYRPPVPARTPASKGPAVPSKTPINKAPAVPDQGKYDDENPPPPPIKSPVMKQVSLPMVTSIAPHTRILSIDIPPPPPLETPETTTDSDAEPMVATLLQEKQEKAYSSASDGFTGQRSSRGIKVISRVGSKQSLMNRSKGMLISSVSFSKKGKEKEAEKLLKERSPSLDMFKHRDKTPSLDQFRLTTDAMNSRKLSDVSAVQEEPKPLIHKKVHQLQGRSHLGSFTSLTSAKARPIRVSTLARPPKTSQRFQKPKRELVLETQIENQKEDKEVVQMEPKKEPEKESEKEPKKVKRKKSKSKDKDMSGPSEMDMMKLLASTAKRKNSKTSKNASNLLVKKAGKGPIDNETSVMSILMSNYDTTKDSKEVEQENIDNEL